MPVIYDVANAVAAGEDPAGGLALLGRRTAVLHLSDTPPEQWRHDPIGTGAIDFAAIGAALRTSGFDGALVLETMSADTARDLVAGRGRLMALGFPAA